MVTDEELTRAREFYKLATANAKSAKRVYDLAISSMYEAMSSWRGSNSVRRVARAELNRLERLRSAEKIRPTKTPLEETPQRLYLRLHNIDPNIIERLDSHGYWTWRNARVKWPETFEFPAFHGLLIGEEHDTETCRDCKQYRSNQRSTTATTAADPLPSNSLRRGDDS